MRGGAEEDARGVETVGRVGGGAEGVDVERGHVALDDGDGGFEVRGGDALARARQHGGGGIHGHRARAGDVLPARHAVPRGTGAELEEGVQAAGAETLARGAHEGDLGIKIAETERELVHARVGVDARGGGGGCVGVVRARREPRGGLEGGGEGGVVDAQVAGGAAPRRVRGRGESPPPRRTTADRRARDPTDAVQNDARRARRHRRGRPRQGGHQAHSRAQHVRRPSLTRVASTPATVAGASEEPSSPGRRSAGCWMDQWTADAQNILVASYPIFKLNPCTIKLSHKWVFHHEAASPSSVALYPSTRRF